MNSTIPLNQNASDTVTLATLGQLPKEVREEVWAWAREFAAVRPPVTQALVHIGQRMGVSYSTARRKYDAWLHSGRSPLSLVNRAKAPDEARHGETTKDFLDWFRALAESNQRKTRPAWRLFCRRWHAGEYIPGLDPDLPRHRLPKGCSYSNLARHCKDKFALAVMRRGMAAAAPHAPQTFTTRAGLWCGSHYMFDDLWHDHFVVFRGKPARVLELDALDLFSGCKCAWGMRPRIQREDGTFEGLKESAMRMLVASLLWSEGYSERGTALVAEHGTAAISQRVEELLYDASGGQITVDRSGIIGKSQAVAGMFPGRGGGNPRMKASLESLRNLIHNEMAMLPAQTGKDVANRPESTAGALSHVADLLKAWQVLARTKPERAALIRLPLLEYHSQFLPFAADVYDTCNRRDWHELEGWSECGHVTIDFRLAPDAPEWISSEDVLRMPETTREMLLGLSRQDPRYMRQRKLSPLAVWRAGRPALKRIPAWVVADILGKDLAQERKCAGRYFVFEDAELSPEPLRYEARITALDGSERELADGTYLTFANPFDLTMLFVHDAKGRHLGVAPRATRVCRADVEALERRYAHNRKRLADALAPVKARHADLTREAAARDAHNAAVISGAPLTPDERAEAARQDNLRRRAEEAFLGGDVSQETELSPDDRAQAALMAKYGDEKP